jgi:hypothetical protein
MEKDSVMKQMEKEIVSLNDKLRIYLNDLNDEESKTIELKDTTSLIINIDDINIENNGSQEVRESSYTEEESSRTVSEDDIDNVNQDYLISNTYVLGSQQSYYEENIRLNVDQMTYEQLLELQEQIGYVSKGFSLPELEVKFNFI